MLRAAGPNGEFEAADPKSDPELAKLPNGEEPDAAVGPKGEEPDAADCPKGEEPDAVPEEPKGDPALTVLVNGDELAALTPGACAALAPVAACAFPVPAGGLGGAEGFCKEWSQ